MNCVNVREATPDDFIGIVRIADSLPEWFDKEGREAIPIDIKHHHCIIAEDSKSIIGFISLFVYEGRLSISWMGVLPEAQNKGVGSKLLQKAEEHGRQLGLKEIATYTLGDSVDYKPYEQTRKFYYKNGFTVYMRFQTDNTSCIEGIKIKKSIEL